MPASPVFDHVCGELESRTDMDRLASRGTLRLALKQAGLDVDTVDTSQMKVVLERVMPAELAARGVRDGEALCGAIARQLGDLRFETGSDRAGDAAAVMARLGS